MYTVGSSEVKSWHRGVLDDVVHEYGGLLQELSNSRSKSNASSFRFCDSGVFDGADHEFRGFR